MAKKRWQKLWIVCEGGPFKGRPTHASRLSPTGSPRLPVVVEADALELGQLYILCRRGHGDMVVAASTSRAKLEPALERLGSAAPNYEILVIPIRG